MGFIMVWIVGFLCLNKLEKMMDKELFMKLLELFTEKEWAKSVLGSSQIGKYVICRSRNEGINAGYVVDLDDTGVILRDARRIWYYKPKDVNKSWYEGVAQSGLSDDSKVSCTVSSKVIIEDYSLTVCSEEAMLSITSKAPNAQN